MDNLNELFYKKRQEKKMTLSTLAQISGLDRTTISRIEKGEREPTVRTAQLIAKGLGTNLSTLLMPLKNKPVIADTKFIRNEDKLKEYNLNKQDILGALNHVYETIAIIDSQLDTNNSPKLSSLVELANLSSIIGNLLGAGIVISSDGKFTRNAPHTYPDLLSTNRNYPDIEIKLALERNLPKGHLPKEGVHLMVRYVLTNDGVYTHGKDKRGDIIEIWEVKIGSLKESDFTFSSTVRDSGKTAYIKTSSLNQMTLIYYNPSLVPYKRAITKEYSGFN